MKWVKIPKEHHALFLAALPDDPRITTMKLFGGIGAAVNGNMFAALWARSVMLRLSPADAKRAFDDGAQPFDPMGRGPRENAVVLPDNVVGETRELRRWLERALAVAERLPPKVKKAPAKKKATARRTR